MNEREKMIAYLREQGTLPPEDATEEELKEFEREQKQRIREKLQSVREEVGNSYAPAATATITTYSTYEPDAAAVNTFTDKVQQNLTNLLLEEQRLILNNPDEFQLVVEEALKTTVAFPDTLAQNQELITELTSQLIDVVMTVM